MTGKRVASLLPSICLFPLLDINDCGVLRLPKRQGKWRMSNATQGRDGSLPRLELKGLTRVGAALVLAAGLAGGPAITDAHAQAGGEEAGGKADAANQRAYAAGTRAFESGDMATAERQLTTALSGGGLPSAQMARALYLRGTALRRQGKPAQAISDLTTAVWLKGGLSDSDKAKALEERQLAYREAGLGDTPPPIGAAPMDQSPSTPAPGGAPQAKPGTQVAVVGPSSFWNNMSMPSLPALSIPGLSSSTPAQPAAEPAAAPPAAQGFASAPAPDAAEAAAAGQAQGFAATAEPAAAAAPAAAWTTETAPVAQAAPQQPTSDAYVPPATPVSTGLNTMPGASPAGEGGVAGGGSTWNPFAGTGQAIGGFFGNVFGSSEASEAGTAVTTGSTAGGAEWGPDTTVVSAQTSSMMQRGPDSPSALPWSGSGGSAAPAQPAAQQKVAARPAGGKFKLQVASVRSREEADKLAETLQRYPAVRDGSVSTEVDEAVIGSMGTFYRVRLGPYPNAKEPGELCQTLKPQGFDCLVVTQ